MSENLPYLNPVDYSVWEILQEKMHKTQQQLKQRLRAIELSKLDHIVIWGSQAIILQS